MKSFKELGLNGDLLQSIEELGFAIPSAVQDKCIPYILDSKKDLIALAQTGTGKTAAFALPILNKLHAKGDDLQAIILCPTRELALQISQDVQRYAKYMRDVSITPVYGGERIDVQIKALRRGTNIVIGTPGRVHDLIRRNVLKLSTIRWVVLDEADEMLDMGFKEDLDAILDDTPATRQTLLFSATISRSVRAIAKQYMKTAEEIAIGTNNIGADNITHEYYIVNAKDRFIALKRILDNLPGVYGILFCRTRIETQDLAEKLKRANYDTDALHGDISQSIRTKIMDRFKKKDSGLLVATDVAARGIDINNLSHVINYGLPEQINSYTHRTGRTGRAQKSGIAISIIGPRDVYKIRGIEGIISKSMEQRQVPSIEDIYTKQIDIYLNKLEGTDLTKSKQLKYMDDVIKRLNKMHKDDLIKSMILSQFGELIDNKEDSYDINVKAHTNSRSENSTNTRLIINLGRKDRFDVKSLFALLNDNRNLKGIEIGRISIMPDHTIFSVEQNDAQNVVKYLAGASWQRRNINISLTTRKEGNSGNRFEDRNSGPRRRRPNRGYSRGNSHGRRR